MRVFVAGATGAIGRPLVRQLQAAGHEVVGMTRSPARAETLRAQGAEAAVADALDAEAVLRVVVAARPEVVVNELTDLSAPVDPRHYEAWLAGTNRLRGDGTRHLVAAARAAGARRLVAQSIAFAYAADPGVKTEESPLLPASAGAMAAAVHAVERQTLASGLAAVVLRYGFFYGPGTGIAPDGAQVAAIRARKLPILGGGRGRFPFVHVEDAAAATVLAVTGEASGIFNVTDDEAAPQREWVPFVAALVGAPPPRRVPLLLARLLAGGMTAMIARLQPVANVRAKRELGWRPRWPRWRDGFRETLVGGARP